MHEGILDKPKSQCTGVKKSWKRDCNIAAALLKLLPVFAPLKVKHLQAHFISRISFSSFSPNSQNI